MKLYIARDIDNKLFLYTSKPICGKDGIFRINETNDTDAIDLDVIELDNNEYTAITFENSPQEVELVIKK